MTNMHVNCLWIRLFLSACKAKDCILFDTFLCFKSKALGKGRHNSAKGEVGFDDNISLDGFSDKFILINNNQNMRKCIPNINLILLLASSNDFYFASCVVGNDQIIRCIFIFRYILTVNENFQCRCCWYFLHCNHIVYFVCIFVWVMN